LKQAVLNCQGQHLTVEDIPLDFTMLMKTISFKVPLKHKHTLEDVRPDFERELLGIILKKVKNDQAFAARFLDIPREVLSSRLEDAA
jgi:DNA-binding NtrC family response regulator